MTTEDGTPVPKIIDFGVAKATAQRLTEKTFFTELGQLVGTPAYMSPEQAELNVAGSTPVVRCHGLAQTGARSWR